MANRYTNLIPSVPINQEYQKITQGFDKVQAEMDAVQQQANETDTRLDNLLNESSAGKDLELVDIRLGSDGVARPTAGELVREIHAQVVSSRYSPESTEYSDIFSLSPNVVQGAMKGKLKGNTDENCISVQPQEIKSAGKNLFPENPIFNNEGTTVQWIKIENGFKLKGSGGGAPRGHVEFRVKPNTTYTFSVDFSIILNSPTGYTNGQITAWGWNYIDGSDIVSLNTLLPASIGSGRHVMSFNTGNKHNVSFTFYASWDKAVAEFDYTNIQLEEGSIATPYEPYQESKAYMKYPLRSVPNGVADEVDLQSGKLTKRCEEAVIDETWFSKATTNNPVGYDVYRVVNLFTTRMLPAGKIGAADGVTSLLSVDGVGFQRKSYWAQLDSLGQYATEADSNGIINLLVPTGQTFASVYGGKTIRFIYQLAQEQIIEDALSNQLTVYPSGTISLVAKKQYVLKAEDVVEMVSEGIYADFARIYITTLTDSMPFKTNVLGQVTLAGRTETPANGYNALENIGKFFVYDATIDFIGVIFPKGTTLEEAQADLAGTIITYDTKPELSTFPTTVHSEPINLAGAVKSESDRNTRQDEQINDITLLLDYLIVVNA